MSALLFFSPLRETRRLYLSSTGRLLFANCVSVSLLDNAHRGPARYVPFSLFGGELAFLPLSRGISACVGLGGCAGYLICSYPTCKTVECSSANMMPSLVDMPRSKGEFFVSLGGSPVWWVLVGDLMC